MVPPIKSCFQISVHNPFVPATILATTQESEIRRIVVQSQLREHKKGLVEWIDV
jgi:hypothetical protein